jgi:hypothetical protein
VTIILFLMLAGPQQPLDIIRESLRGNPVTRVLTRPKLPPIPRMRPTPMDSLMTPEVAMGEALIGMP